MNTPSLEIILVLGLGVLALLFFGYQLDEMHRRVKELETDEYRASHVEARIHPLLEMIRNDINSLHSWQGFLAKSLTELEEKAKPRKRGRPKKIVDGKNDTP